MARILSYVYECMITFCTTTFFRASSVGCTPKDSISAPPVEGLYDARSSEFINSPFTREQVRRKSLADSILNLPII